MCMQTMFLIGKTFVISETMNLVVIQKTKILAFLPWFDFFPFYHCKEKCRTQDWSYFTYRLCHQVYCFLWSVVVFKLSEGGADI